MRQLLIIVGLISGMAGAALYAHEPEDVGRFSAHDLNHDGQLDRYEYEQLQQERLSYESSRPYRGKRLATDYQFSDMDTDADGFINEDEMIQTLNHQLRLQRRVRARERRWSE